MLMRSIQVSRKFEVKELGWELGVTVLAGPPTAKRTNDGDEER